MANICRTVEAGRHGSIPEFKVEWDGLIPVTYHRTSSMVVDVELCGPDDLLDSIWSDISSCAISSAVAAGIAAIIASPPAALPTFEAAFYACIASAANERAEDIKVGLSVQQRPNGPWKKV